VRVCQGVHSRRNPAATGRWARAATRSALGAAAERKRPREPALLWEIKGPRWRRNTRGTPQLEKMNSSSPESVGHLDICGPEGPTSTACLLFCIKDPYYSLNIPNLAKEPTRRGRPARIPQPAGRKLGTHAAAQRAHNAIYT
jgi:hypothetical protein